MHEIKGYKGYIEALKDPEIFENLSNAEQQYVEAAHEAVINNRKIFQVQMDVILDLHLKYITKDSPK